MLDKESDSRTCISSDGFLVRFNQLTQSMSAGNSISLQDKNTSSLVDPSHTSSLAAIITKADD